MDDKKTNIVRIIIFAIFIIAIVTAMSMIVGATGTSTKYNELAQCISQKKLKFYGAFWCPHCQAQKAAFGGSAELLPYIECSNADRSPTQACIDAKIEKFPTWVYPNELSIKSEKNPIVCEVQPGPASQPPECSISQYGSSVFKTWVFPGLRVNSEKEPTNVGSLWTFVPGSRTVGELDDDQGIKYLAGFAGCQLPADNTTK